MTVNEIAKLFSNDAHRGYVVGSIMDLPEHYIVYLMKPGLRNGEIVLNNEYSVNKKTKKIEPFRVAMAPKKLADEYREALRKPMMFMRNDLKLDK
jgi:uncharacterized protein (DUF3820 family)